MSDSTNHRFGTEEIRRVRDEDYERYTALRMTVEEISQDISQRAQEFYKRRDEIRRERCRRQAAESVIAC